MDYIRAREFFCCELAKSGLDTLKKNLAHEHEQHQLGCHIPTLLIALETTPIEIFTCPKQYQELTKKVQDARTDLQNKEKYLSDSVEKRKTEHDDIVRVLHTLDHERITQECEITGIRIPGRILLSDRYYGFNLPKKNDQYLEKKEQFTKAINSLIKDLLFQSQSQETINQMTELSVKLNSLFNADKKIQQAVKDIDKAQKSFDDAVKSIQDYLKPIYNQIDKLPDYAKYSLIKIVEGLGSIYQK